MTITKTYKVYLSKKCHKNLDVFLTQLRHLYNDSLEERITVWKDEQRSVSFFDQCKTLVEKRKDPYWSQFPTSAQRSILERLNRAYQHFFSKGGFPRFKSWKNGIHSFEIIGPKIISLGKYHSIKIKGLGRFRFKGILPEGKFKRLRIIKSPIRIKLQIMTELPDNNKKDNREPLGIDLGIKSRATLSNGVMISKQIVDRKEIKRKQRILVKAKKDSNNREKKRLSLVKEWQRVREREKGTLHETTAGLIKDYSSKFVVEDLKIQNMLKNKKLSRSIIEQQWGTFVKMLAYKAERAGGWLSKVDPKNTTQRCSGCGKLPTKKIGLPVRTYSCEYCGLSIDRDINAANNILFKGLSLDLAGLADT